MRLKFHKMQGLGNDFVVIDAYTQTITLTPAQIKRLAERRWGVGCDQVLLVQSPHDPAADFYYRIFNADGSEAEQCGNGARCFLRFVREQGLTAKTAIQVQTVNGMLSLEQMANGEISVDMGEPQFEPNKIPFASTQRAAHYSLQAGEQNLRIGAVSMGNPHAVLQVEDVACAPVAQIGPQLERHPQFPQGVNVGFMQIVDRHHIHLRVYERGAGETLACGSGACAAVAVGRIQGLLAENVQVTLPGGALMIHWPGEGRSLRMRGPAETVFEGEITL